VNYLLDTCVISELVKPTPDRRVAKWIRNQDEESLYLSVITIGEIQKGIAKLPEAGTKKRTLQNWLNTEMRERFSGRILEIAIDVASFWGHILGSCERKGTVLPAIDSLIAAQGLFHKMTIVTRNVSDMEASGALLFNPWQS
jgi:predicted nucleic acid-binding protein